MGRDEVELKNKEINTEQSASSLLSHLIWGYLTGKKSTESLLQKLKNFKVKDLIYGYWMGEGTWLPTKEPPPQPLPTNEAQWTTNLNFAESFQTAFKCLLLDTNSQNINIWEVKTKVKSNWQKQGKYIHTYIHTHTHTHTHRHTNHWESNEDIANTKQLENMKSSRKWKIMTAKIKD